MTDIPIAQVYAVVQDYADYRGLQTSHAEVKAFVDRFLAKRPDPKDCIYATYGRCSFNLADLPSSSLVCVGLDACKKADMLLGVRI